MRNFPIAAMAALMILLSACSSERNGADSAEIAFADKIIMGGTVITVDDSNPGAQALAIRNGLIVAVGPQADVMAWRGV